MFFPPAAEIAKRGWSNDAQGPLTQTYNRRTKFTLAKSVMLLGTKPATDKTQIVWNAGCGGKKKAGFLDFSQPSNQQLGVNNKNDEFFRNP